MNNDDFVFGWREIWGQPHAFGISREDLTRHLFVVGQTGVGKSALISSLFLQAVTRGQGVGVLDPHGDLSKSLLDLIPRHRVKDVIHFSPAQTDAVPAFNPISGVLPHARHLMCSGLVSAMRSLFAASWGPRTEYLLMNALMALLETPDATLLGLPRLLTDERYRHWVLKFVQDPIVLGFWRNEFSRMDPRFRQEVIAPLQNKIGQILLSPALRRMLGVVRSRIDLRYVMDHHKIFVGDLAKGRLGEEGSNLIGSLLLSLFQHAALSRVDIPESQRQHFLLLVDEMPQFTTEAIASGLAEARKYHLSLGLFAQHTDQLTEKVRNAVFGNVGSMISFRVSESDAELLSRQYGKQYAPEHFASLDNHEIVVRLSQNGKQLQPFTGRTYAPSYRRIGRSHRILRRSRERYCVNGEKIDANIRRWMKRKNWGA
jgi:hypothetical protein